MSKTFTLQKLLVLILFYAAGINVAAAQQADIYYVNSKAENLHQYSYKIFSAANHSFGYNIYDGEILIVHQPTVPGKQGWNGFASQSEAVSAALKTIAEKVNPKTLSLSSAADFPHSK